MFVLGFGFPLRHKCTVSILCHPQWASPIALPVHGARLGPVVGHGVEDVAHAGVLGALLGRAEVVVHHLVLDVVGDATAAVRDPARRARREARECTASSREHHRRRFVQSSLKTVAHQLPQEAGDFWRLLLKSRKNYCKQTFMCTTIVQFILYYTQIIILCKFSQAHIKWGAGPDLALGLWVWHIWSNPFDNRLSQIWVTDKSTCNK